MELLVHLRNILQRLPPASGYLLAYSGGLDSQVLLHALARLRTETGLPVAACHVHHGLSPNADLWSEHCRASCEALDIPYAELRVDATAAPGESREAAARAARYAALADALEIGQMLLTAHHQDDQAESMLLMLLRGSGAAGLAGMPPCKPFGAGLLGRPLLGVPRAALRGYAESHGLSWVDDESNFDTGFDRNYLRHDVLPVLRHRWPAADRLLARSAAHLAESAELLREVAQADRQAAQGSRPGTLSVAALTAMSGPRRRNTLRGWFLRRGLPSPDSRHLARIEQDLLGARVDAEPRVTWPGAEVRRYRDDLYALAPLVVPSLRQWPWAWEAPLHLPHGTLHAEPCIGAGVAARWAEATVTLREGGECCRPAGRAHHRELKKLFQEAGVPPWERERTPLLFIDGQLAAVAGRWVCAPYAAAAGEAGWLIRWEDVADIAREGENKDN